MLSRLSEKKRKTLCKLILAKPYPITFNDLEPEKMKKTISLNKTRGFLVFFLFNNHDHPNKGFSHHTPVDDSGLLLGVINLSSI